MVGLLKDFLRWLYWRYAAKGDTQALPQGTASLGLRGQEVAVIVDGGVVHTTTDPQEAKRWRQHYRDRGIAVDLWVNRH